MAPTRKRSKGKRKTKKRLWGGTAQSKRKRNPGNVNNLAGNFNNLSVSKQKREKPTPSEQSHVSVHHTPKIGAASVSKPMVRPSLGFDINGRLDQIKKWKLDHGYTSTYGGTILHYNNFQKGTHEVRFQNASIMEKVANALAEKHMSMEYGIFINDPSVKDYIIFPQSTVENREKQFRIETTDDSSRLKELYEILCEEARLNKELNDGKHKIIPIRRLKEMGNATKVGVNSTKNPIIDTILSFGSYKIFSDNSHHDKQTTGSIYKHSQDPEQTEEHEVPKEVKDERSFLAKGKNKVAGWFSSKFGY